MGQVKKLYAFLDESDKSAVYFMQRTAHLSATCNQVLDLIRKAEFLLNDWLVANTDKVFREQPDIDNARSYLSDAIELLGGPHDTQGAALQVGRPHEDGDHPRSGADA